MVQGQMLPDSLRGKALKEILVLNDIKEVVEIGTWKGLGSTLCILDAISKNVNFISIESSVEFHEIAKINLKKHLRRVELLLGTIVTSEDVLSFVSNLQLNDDQKKWLIEDLENINNCQNILNRLPECIDFLLLDGGEFSTFAEWSILKDRTRIVALDDITQIKCERIHNELLLDNSNYKLIFLTEEGNGFSIFKKID